MHADLRVDSSHAPAAPTWTVVSDAVAARARSHSSADERQEGVVATSHPADTGMESLNPQVLDPLVLRQSHLEDLTNELQRLATALDGREATLNAREALLEHRERTARAWTNHRRQELDEREQAIRIAEAELEEQRRLLQAALRGDYLGRL